MKRARLLTNLKKVIRRAEMDLCPLRLTEIWIFGSFLRLKQEPRDLDLVIFYRQDKEFDSKVELFRQFVLDQRRTQEGLKQLEALVTNAELGAKFGSILGLDVRGWLPYIRTTDFSFFRFLFSPQEVTKRVLKERLQGIQIAGVSPVSQRDQVFSEMTASKFRFLWSRDKPDLEANLLEAFIPEEQSQTLLSELRNFVIQAEQNRARYEVLVNSAIWLIEKMNGRRDLPSESELNARMLDFAANRGVADKFRSWVIGTAAEDPGAHVQITTLDIDHEIARIRSSGTEGIGEVVEHLRMEIKLLRGKARFIGTLLHQMTDVSEQRNNQKDRTEIAVLGALSSVPMYEASDETKRDALKDIGLAEINRRIILVANPGSKADYFLADSEEELVELLDRKESGRVAKEHVTYLRPILRKVFPPDTHTDVFITTQKNQEGNCIPVNAGLYASFDGSSGIFLDKARQLGFQVSESHSPGSYRAYLSVDISPLNGDRAKIRDLVRMRLANELTANGSIVE